MGNQNQYTFQGVAMRNPYIPDAGSQIEFHELSRQEKQRFLDRLRQYIDAPDSVEPAEMNPQEPVVIITNHKAGDDGVSKMYNEAEILERLDYLEYYDGMAPEYLAKRQVLLQALEVLHDVQSKPEELNSLQRIDSANDYTLPSGQEIGDTPAGESLMECVKRIEPEIMC